MSPVQMKLWMDEVERVLHAPGNLQDGKLTEMTITLDGALSKERLEVLCKELVGCLKRKGERFQNVRVNVVSWMSDEQTEAEVLPLAMLGIGRGLEKFSKQGNPVQKHLDCLAGYLKLFQARSKLIILVSDGNWHIESEEALQQNLQPFLYRKWIWMDENGDSKGRVCRYIENE